FMRTVNKKRSQILTCICIAVLVVCFNYGMHYFRGAKFSGIPEEYMVTSAVRFFVCTVFLMVGYMVGLYRELLMKYAGQFFLIFGSAFWLCWYHMGCRINIQMLTIGSMRNLLVLGVLGSLMTILFCMILPKDLPLNKIGRASLDIMVLHCAPMPFFDWEMALFKKAKFIPTPFWIALVLLMFCYALRLYFMEPARKILRGRRDGNLDRDLSGTAR
ncbi:MAG: hypothetical protein KBT01_02630, partial [Clostridiales bacterium]|nr:hypothetical protein [Candidatus Blautia equi]